MERIILATSSPYRIEAFRSLGIDFISEGSNVNEKSNGRPQNPRDLVLYLARSPAKFLTHQLSLPAVSANQLKSMIVPAKLFYTTSTAKKNAQSYPGNKFPKQLKKPP